MSLPLDVLKELIDYDPVSGGMTWRTRDAKFFKLGRFSREANAARWNTVRSGTSVFGGPCRDGYVRGHILGSPYLLHRVKWAMHYGAWPTGIIDHIDGNPENNDIKNLRASSIPANARNMRKPKSNTSGIVGVRFHKRAQKWNAQITVNGRAIHLGTFDTASAAAEARKAADATYGFSVRHGSA